MFEIPNGEYDVINHITGTRYSGIYVGSGKRSLSFVTKSLMVERPVLQLTGVAPIQLNNLNRASPTTDSLSNCAPDDQNGKALVLPAFSPTNARSIDALMYN